jgi:phosphoribosylformylglycinamidine cyclo-ligase
MPEPFSYRESGVDISLEAEGIASLVKALTYRRKGMMGMMGKVGHFAGLIGWGKHALALTVDGVGTKMLVADHQSDWSTVGIDCIAMNVNDLYVLNLEPVAFVDYIATDSISVEKMAQIGRGLNEGARQANIDIIGGETATLKGLVTGLDLAGTCLGIQEKDHIITGNGIRPGDLIFGLPSSGIHSNGLTLARSIVDSLEAWNERLSSGRTLGEELLIPTRIYAGALKVCRQTAIHGMCHITGGGLLNFSRLSRYGFSFEDPLPVPEIFQWIGEAGNISRDELYRTFNMGMGYAFIAPKDSLSKISAIFPDVKAVGRITREPGIRFRGDTFT